MLIGRVFSIENNLLILVATNERQHFQAGFHGRGLAGLAIVTARIVEE
jgi:hypothetical protein